MGRGRRARRKAERARARHPISRPGLSLAARAGLGALGVLALAGGVAILARGSAGNAERLSRVAGILILIGLALLFVAAFGRV